MEVEEGQGENEGDTEGEQSIPDDNLMKKLAKMPPTAGYAGDHDPIDVPVYLWD